MKIIDKTKIVLLLILTIPTIAMAYTKNTYFSDKQADGTILYYRLDTNNGHDLTFVGWTPASASIKSLVLPTTYNDGSGETFNIVKTGYDAKYNCRGLEDVTLQEGFTEFMTYPFYNAKLKHIVFPASFKTIHFSGFRDVVPFVEVSSANTLFKAGANGELLSKDGKTLYCVPTSNNKAVVNGTYTIDSQIETINDFAFWQTEGLTKVVLPQALKKVYTTEAMSIAFAYKLEEFEMPNTTNGTFKTQDGVLFNALTNQLVAYPNGKKDKTYTVPSGIKSIASGAMQYNSLVEDINLNEVTTLQRAALFSLSNLKTVTIPRDMDLKGLTQGSIVDCTKIAEYKVDENNKYLVADDGVIFSKDKTQLLFYPPAHAGITYNIPRTVKTIGSNAFSKAKNITYLAIPNNVETMSDGAFSNLENLTSVSFEEPSKITSIASAVFARNKRLKTVTLPSSITLLSNIFFQCDNLERINIPNGSKLKAILPDAFASNKLLKYFYFAGDCDLERIQSGAFKELKNLVSFNVPNSVKEIEGGAFIGCTNLEDVSFGDKSQIESIRTGAFSNCNLKEMTIPASVKTIEREAFNNCKSFHTIHITENTTSISPEAFKGCTHMQNIDVSPNNNTYSSVRGYLLSKDKKTLVYYPEGMTLIGKVFTPLAPSIETIGDYAFYNNQKIEHIVIPNKVTTLGKRAFGLCYNLKKITFLNEKVIENINTKQNEMTFDDGTQTNGKSLFNNIDICVRKNLAEQYKASSFYKRFKNGSNPQTTFFVGTEEYVEATGNTVELLSTNKNVYTFVIPKTIKHNNKEYTIKLLGDYLFQNSGNTNIKEVVLKHNVIYVGAKAFITNIENNTSNIKNVFIACPAPTDSMLSSKKFYLDDTGASYNEIADDAHVYVKTSALQRYLDKWEKHIFSGTQNAQGEYNKTLSKFNFTNSVSNKIPYEVKNRYGTFAREFDADFKPYFAEKGTNSVAAFVASSTVKKGSGDFGNSPYHTTMVSIDECGGDPSSFYYVPANTGVLLKVLDKDNTDTDFYYTIGENDTQQFNIENNAMHGIVEDNATIEASQTQPVYIMRKGIFRRVDSNITSMQNVHKAYLKLNVAVNVASSLGFDFNGATTSIEQTFAPAGNNILNNTVYDLSGAKINTPQQSGIYIVNGKKVFIKK